MNIKRLLKLGAVLGTGVLAAVVAMLTIGAGRDQCPQCGYLGDLSDCKHCGWRACLSCWQQKSQYNTCPGCGRSNP